MNRNIPVIATVLLLHGLALWALHTGLLRRAVELIVPVQLLASVVAPPRVEIAPPRQAPAPPPKPLPKVPQSPQTISMVAPAAAPEPAPVLVTSGPSSVTVAQAATPAPRSPAPPAPALHSTIGAAAPLPAPAPPKIELPSSDAAYLQNPRPAYPAMSKRLNEQGTVRVGVLIGTDGQAQKAEIRQSSGFERLDKVALETALQWRYVPGKRDGVPQAMWFIVPLVFAFE